MNHRTRAIPDPPTNVPPRPPNQQTKTPTGGEGAQDDPLPAPLRAPGLPRAALRAPGGQQAQGRAPEPPLRRPDGQPQLPVRVCVCVWVLGGDRYRVPPAFSGRFRRSSHHTTRVHVTGSRTTWTRTRRTTWGPRRRSWTSRSWWSWGRASRYVWMVDGGG